jgi:hypothetical protein
MGPRFVDQHVVRTITIQKELSLQQVVVEDANIRSPNGTKPMRRAYGYLPTREAAAAFGADYAEHIHERNVGSQTKCMEEFVSTASEQKQIEQRQRDRKRRDINKQKYGTSARRGGPARSNEVKSAKTPRPEQPGRAHWSATTGVIDRTDGLLTVRWSASSNMISRRSVPAA